MNRRGVTKVTPFVGVTHLELPSGLPGQGTVHPIPVHCTESVNLRGRTRLWISYTSVSSPVNSLKESCHDRNSSRVDKVPTVTGHRRRNHLIGLA